MCFYQEIEIRFFHNGKAAQNCIFSYIDFSYYQCISATFRKRIEQLLHQSLEPTLLVCILYKCASYLTGHIIPLCAPPTGHIIPPNISSHRACHPTGHLIPMCILSQRESYLTMRTLSHQVCHPTGHLIPVRILSHDAQLIPLCMSSHRASYQTIHPTRHLILHSLPST